MDVVKHPSNRINCMTSQNLGTEVLYQKYLASNWLNDYKHAHAKLSTK